MFRVVTLNVRGLNPKKLDLISEFFSDKQLDLACIQETMISDVSSQNALAKKCGTAPVFGLRPLVGEGALLFFVPLVCVTRSQCGRKMPGGDSSAS